jgi:SagB-type dehydrogenase family enzyme
MFSYHDLIEHHNQTKFGLFNLGVRHPRDYIQYCEAARQFENPLKLVACPDVQNLSIADLTADSSSLSKTESTLVLDICKFLSLSCGRRTEVKALEGRLRRVVASAGNFQPFEIYVLTNQFSPIEVELYHFAAEKAELHALQKYKKTKEKPFAMVFVTSLPFKSYRKYGLRGLRFSQIDAGHLLAGFQLAARALGLDCDYDKQIENKKLWQHLGLSELLKKDHEVLAYSFRLQQAQESSAFSIEELKNLGGEGSPDCNQIGPHLDFEKVDEFVDLFDFQTELFCERSLASCRQNSGANRQDSGGNKQDPNRHLKGAHHNQFSSTFTKEEVLQMVQSRVSHREMSKDATLEFGQFKKLFADFQERSGVDAGSRLKVAPYVHNLFFVKKVKGLESGLYIEARDRRLLPSLRASLSPLFYWQPVTEFAQNFYFLKSISVESWPTLSVGGSFATDYNALVFQLGLFDRCATDLGLDVYAPLLWECGFIGQSIYWAAAKNKLKACGAGGYLDDRIHSEMLGCNNFSAQVLSCYSIGM